MESIRLEEMALGIETDVGFQREQVGQQDAQGSSNE
jgi:hypothetical protein